MATDVQQSPKTDQAIANPFDVVASLLMKARLSLSEVRGGSYYPRYARILRSKNSGGISTIETVVKTGTEGFTFTISKLIDLTLDARELLDDVDALVALSEVGIDIIRTVTSQEFLQSLELSFAASTGSGRVSGTLDIGSAIQGLDEAMNKTQNFLRFVPAPEDLDRIGYELYRLACIHTSSDPKIVLNYTGKARLLQWGFGFEWFVNHKVEEERKSLSTLHLGKVLIDSKRPPEDFSVDYETVNIYNYSIEENTPETDMAEAIRMLANLNYPKVSGNVVEAINEENVLDLKLAIKQFQYYNEIPVSGELDNETINRLFNIDSICKNVKRAVPCKDYISFSDGQTGGYLNLKNGNADSFKDENILPDSSRGKTYYQLGKSYNPNSHVAWILNPNSSIDEAQYVGLHEHDTSDDNRKLVHGFVGLQSRFKINDNEPFFEGGAYSEGEAAEGEFFFAARHTEPWRSGRINQPGADALYGAKNMTYEKAQEVLKGSVSQMYQIVDIPSSIFEILKSDDELVFYAHCLQRSMYRDTYAGIPDRGRIQLQILDCDENGNPKTRHANGKTYFQTLGDCSKAIPKWMPDKKLTADILNNPNLDRKTTWLLLQSQRWTFKSNSIPKPGTIAKAKVIVEGLYSSAWDIDAYFDDIRIRWQIIKKPL